jgi:hypothetical protein
MGGRLWSFSRSVALIFVLLILLPFVLLLIFFSLLRDKIMRSFVSKKLHEIPDLLRLLLATSFSGWLDSLSWMMTLAY